MGEWVDRVVCMKVWDNRRMRVWENGCMEVWVYEVWLCDDV